MILQPLFSLMLLIPLVLILLGFTVWQLFIAKKASDKIPWARRAVLVLLVGMMAVGPSVPGGKSPAGMLNLDVIFVVDRTYSMIAEDYSGAQVRLTGVKADIAKLSDRMAGARFSVITFDREAEVLMPMTTDRGALDTVLSSLGVSGFATSKGTTIDKPVQMLQEQLEANKKQNPQRPNLVFYLGDGEQTALGTQGSFAAIQPLIKGGAVLGYGTQAGGKMKDSIYEPETADYLEDYYTTDHVYGAPALSKANPDALKIVAGQLGVSYFDRNQGGDISATFGESNAERIADATKPVTFYTNLYYIFAIPFAALFIWELLYLFRRYQELKAAAPEAHRE